MIGVEDDFDLCWSDIIEVVNCVDFGDGVVIFIDMFGGMLLNFVIFCMSWFKVEVFVGINLFMLVKFVKVCEECLLFDVIVMV